MTRPSELLFTEVSVKNKIGVLDLPDFKQMKQGTECTRSHDIYVSFSLLQRKLRGIFSRERILIYSIWRRVVRMLHFFIFQAVLFT